MNDSLNLELTFKDIIDASSSKLMSGGYLSSIDIIIVLTATLICSALIAWMYSNQRRPFDVGARDKPQSILTSSFEGAI